MITCNQRVLQRTVAFSVQILDSKLLYEYTEKSVTLLDEYHQLRSRKKCAHEIKKCVHEIKNETDLVY